MSSAGVLVGMCAVLACLAAVPRVLAAVGHGDAGSKGLLQIPSNGSLAGCPTHCGDVKISYPFGIGHYGCFRQGFELTCDQTARPPSLFLRNGTTNITSIYAGSNFAFASAVGFNVTLSQQGAVTYYYNMTWAAEGVIISDDYNLLYVIGCDVDVYMFGDNMTDLVGYCMSICTADDTGVTVRDGYCKGFGCCRIDLSPRDDLTTITIKLVRRNGTRAQLDEVKVLFSEYYNFASSDLYSNWVNTSNVEGVRFQFAITDQPNCERAQVNKDSYACNNESTCNNLPSGRGYNCWCPNNRQGNPYVVNGCTPSGDTFFFKWFDINF